MQKVIMVGNLTKEPEKVDGQELCKMSIAVPENYVAENGERAVQYFNIVAWKTLANNCMKYLHKGSKISLVGKLNIRYWEDKDKQKHYVTEIIASEIEFIYTGKKEEEQPKITQIDDDGLPF